MPGKAVVAYVFPDPDDVESIKAIVAVSRELFKQFPELKIHAAVGDAADTIAFFTENKTLAEEDEESNWEKHARRELGLLGEEPDVIECVCKTLRAWSTFGHSGGSHAALVPVLMELLQFHNLTPLTNDPAEWNHISEGTAGQPNLWQSQRNSEAFSNDGGMTYYLVFDNDKVIYTSKAAIAHNQIDPAN